MLAPLANRVDEYGRTDCRRLDSPFYGVKVTGALFHTQGGLKWIFTAVFYGQMALPSLIYMPEEAWLPASAGTDQVAIFPEMAS